MARRFGVLLGVLAFLGGIAAAQAVQYQMVDLGSLYSSGDAYGSVAYDINDSGQVVGYSYWLLWDGTAYYQQAYLWQNGTIQGLGTLSGDSCSIAYGINNSGQIVGASSIWGSYFYEGSYFYGDEINAHSFLWHNGVMQDLGALPGGINKSTARAINDSGQVVGCSWTSTPCSNDRAYIWQNGVMQDAGMGAAYDINDNGQVVGYWSLLWQNGKDQYLDRTWHSMFTGINDSGQIVGYFYDANYRGINASLWQNGVRQDLGTLPGKSMSRATGINNSGQVVGYSSLDPMGIISSNAFVWQNGVMQDLGPGQANAINNSGQIVGKAYDANGICHAVMWNPVPEPSSLLALASGLSAFGIFLRRRK